MDISVRNIHNDMIKPSDNGGLESVVDSVTHKLLIIDTTIGSFIPPQVWKMTPRLRQICGCWISIIAKDMKIDFKIFRTRIVIYLEQKYVGRYTVNSLFSTTSASHYKYKVFTYSA